MSDSKWTHATCESIANRLATLAEIRVSSGTVRRLLGEMGYSLKSNKKCLSAGNSPDRDIQFKNIDQLRKKFSDAGDPIISVDTKKKELIGLFKNNGRTWAKEAMKVKDHDFRTEAEGIAAPYGIYDVEKNFGTLVIGRSSDTPEFAVNCIVKWWFTHGQRQYSNSTQILILADGGGSNGCRPRAWKLHLQEQLSDKLGLIVTVAHYPTGASKWNPIEHRMFSEISKTWQAEPLVSFDAVVKYAGSTKTKTGLAVEAYHDEQFYEKGLKVSDKDMKELAITYNGPVEKWNYIISPRRHSIESSQRKAIGGVA